MKQIRHAIIALTLLLLLPGMTAKNRPEPPPPFKIGVLFWHDSANDQRAWQGIEEGLQVSGMRYRIDLVDARQQEKRALQALTRWRRDRLDLVYTMGTRATQLAAKQLKRIPLVFVAVTDPRSAGLPAPGKTAKGRNITGVSNFIHPRLLLREFRRAMPGLRRLGVLQDPRNPVSKHEVEAARDFLAPLPPGRRTPQEAWEKRLRQELELVVRTVPSAEKLADATRALATDCQAIWAPIDYLVYQNLQRVTAITEKRKVPLFSSSLKGIQSAVLGVTVDFRMLGLQAAAMALRILEQKTPPGDIPVTTLRWNQVVVNLDAARRIDFQVPLTTLCTAEEIIDAKR